MLLAIDIGNTRIKYAVFENNTIIDNHFFLKEDFLKELEGEKRIIKINTDRYRITGVPFYNNKIENDFKKSLESVLEV